MAMAMAADSTAGLQEITRKLQEERDALRASVDELSQQLHMERSARASAEHDAQVKELELVHEQHRTRHTRQSLRDKLAQVEKELEEAHAQHERVVMARTIASDKITALTSELAAMTAKYKKETAKREDLGVEMDELREEARAIAMDRDQLVQRTEAEARRMRELWDQITREHTAQVSALTAELDQSRQDKREVHTTLEELHRKQKEMEALMAALRDEKSELQQKMTHSSDKALAMQQRLEEEKERERGTGQVQGQLAMEVQHWQHECKLAQEREQIAKRELALARDSLAKCERDTEAKHEELLALKSEFSELLDKYERSREQFKQDMHERDARTRLRHRQLEQRHQYVEALAGLRQKEIKEYKRVVHTVNSRLNAVHATQQTMEAETARAVKHVPVAPKSLNIHRH